jgi:hypothetical protein
VFAEEGFQWARSSSWICVIFVEGKTDQDIGEIFLRARLRTLSTS